MGPIMTQPLVFTPITPAAAAGVAALISTTKTTIKG
jgi:hypothetical protein